MQGISPCIWFNNNIEEAVNCYTMLFANSSIGKIAHYQKEAAAISGQPEGAILTMAFRLAGQDFLALNGGPYYSLTPAISFFVSCDTEAELDALWAGLSENGMALMPLAEYPFSKKFGWLQDRFGVSWQLNLAPRKQKIAPFFLFVKEQHGRAAEAMEFFTSVFEGGKTGSIERFGAGEHEPEGSVKHGIFELAGQEFMASESAMNHAFTFTGAISLMVYCDSQHEIDHYWYTLISGGGKESMCGWLEDKFGISWQIVPTCLDKLMADTKRGNRVMQALLQMRKLDIDALKKAHGEA